MQDILHVLTLVGAIQGILFGLLLFRLPKGNRVANRFLALFLLVFSICMVGIVAYLSHWILQAPHFALLHTPFGAVQGAPFLLYLVAMSKKDFRMQLRHWALFIPFLVVAIWLGPFYMLPAEEKQQLLASSYTHFPATWRYVFIFSTLLSLSYIIAAYFVVIRHERVIHQVYSNTQDKTLLWTRHFLYACTAVFLTCVLMSFFDIGWADAFSNLFFCVVIYVFGYRAMRQPEIFNDLGFEAIPETTDIALVHPPLKYEKSGLSTDRAHTLLERLDYLVEKEEVFLDPTLNLQQLAARMEIPPYQLSQLLNQFKGESFSDFVNRYRVAYFKKAANNPANAHLSLLGIAFESGFNSKAAFNAVIKKMTGLTPSSLVKE